MSVVSAKLFNSSNPLGPLDPAANKQNGDGSGAIDMSIESQEVIASTHANASAMHASYNNGGAPNGRLHDRQESSAYPPYPSSSSSGNPPRSGAVPYGQTAHTAVQHDTEQSHIRADTSSTTAPGRRRYGRGPSEMQIFGTPQVGIIGQHKPRDIVRLDRDYSEGEICQFWSGYPFELEGRVRRGLCLLTLYGLIRRHPF